MARTVEEWKTFVEAWIEGGAKRAASVFGITEGSARVRASNLRKRGVKLPRQCRKYVTMNDMAEELNAHIVKLTGGKKRK